MGIFCGLGAIMLTHLTASEREPAAVRVAAAAGAAGRRRHALLHVLARRDRRRDRRPGPLPAARPPARARWARSPAAGLPVAFALQRAYGSELLARNDYAGADAREQGRALLVVVIGCVVAAAVLRVAGAARSTGGCCGSGSAPRTRRRVFAASGIAALLALRDRHRRPSTCPTASTSSAAAFVQRQRAAGRPGPALAADQGRQQRPPRDLAGRARRRRASEPWRGEGAGTFRLLWEREPPRSARARRRRALALLRDAGGAGLDRPRPARDRARGPARWWPPRGSAGPGRHAYAAFIAAGIALLVHAAVDWDWEMPALFIWFFGAAGVVLAAPADAARALPAPRAAGAPARGPRVPARWR